MTGNACLLHCGFKARRARVFHRDERLCSHKQRVEFFDGKASLIDDGAQSACGQFLVVWDGKPPVGRHGLPENDMAAFRFAAERSHDNLDHLFVDGWGNGLIVSFQAFEIAFDGFVNIVQGGSSGWALGDAARQRGNLRDKYTSTLQNIVKCLDPVPYRQGGGALQM